MINKEQVVSEIRHIANILTLAIPTQEWGGKDEASGGKPGRISRALFSILEELPVTWDKDKSVFKLSGSKRDDKGVGGIKTWVWANLPGKYKDQDFVFKIYRNGKDTKYSFHLDETRISPTIATMLKIKDIFDYYFKVDSDGDGVKKTNPLALLNKVTDLIYQKGGEIYKEVKDQMSSFINSPIKKISKDTAKHNIYLKYFAPQEDLTDLEPSMSQMSIENISKFVKKFIEDGVEGEDTSGISVKTYFKKVQSEDKEPKGYVLHITIKF